MNRQAWLVIGLLILAGCSSESPPSAATASPASSRAPSPSPVFEVYKPVPDLCAVVDAPGDPVADHSEKSNYLLYTCERGAVIVSALFFTTASDAALRFKDVRENVTGSVPVNGIGAEAFSAGTSLWVRDANLMLMVRFKSGGSADSAADLARKSLPRLRGA